MPLLNRKVALIGIDSAKILFLDEKSEIRLRAYKHSKTEIDSLDITTKTISSRDTILKIIKTQHK